MTDSSHADAAFEAWRRRARQLLSANVPPEQVRWPARSVRAFPGAPVSPAVHVPRRFVALARDAIHHDREERFALLYRLLWRLTHGEPTLLEAPDPLVRRVERMAEAARRDPAVQARHTLDGLRQDAARCRSCPLHQAATQAVFGEGPPNARLMLVGEQPGDQEDVAGRPFVGPAGQVLDRALVEAGIARSEVYVTNAVKHFKFTPRGKRRIHKNPDLQEITACRSWLEHEIAAVKPALIVALGASAGRALLGRAVGVATSRGRLYALPSCVRVMVTIHPSYVLRIPEPQRSAAEYRRLVDDLRMALARIDETERAELPLLAKTG